MTTPIKYNPEAERYAVQKLAKRTRKLIEKQLTALEAVEGDIPASQLDVLMKALLKLPEVISSLEKMEHQRLKREEHEKQMAQMLKSLPATPGTRSTSKPVDDPYEDVEPETIQLPFPALRIGVAQKDEEVTT